MNFSKKEIREEERRIGKRRQNERLKTIKENLEDAFWEFDAAIDYLIGYHERERYQDALELCRPHGFVSRLINQLKETQKVVVREAEWELACFGAADKDDDESYMALVKNEMNPHTYLKEGR